MAHLSVYYHDKPPYQRKLDGEIVIGRALGCQMWLDDVRLSRRHCRVYQEGEHWVLEDLGSTNGTFVRDESIKRYTLRDGDSFEAGDSRIVYHADDERMNVHRPSDPASASQIGRAMIETMMHDSAAQSPVTTPLPRVPEVHAAAQRSAAADALRQSGDVTSEAVPLPFARPPAQPIVSDAPRPQRQSWWRSLTSWMKR